MQVEQWPIDRPIPYARNARVIPQQAIDKVAASIKEFGWQQPIVVDGDGVIIVGHTRLLAAQKLGLAEVPVHVATDLTPAQVKAYRLADNRVHEEARWDTDLLRIEMEELLDSEVDALLTGFNQDEIDALLAEVAEDEGGDGVGLGAGDNTGETEEAVAKREEARQTLRERFGVPPFTVLDARQGYWQERKRKWLDLGIKSEVGRGGNLLRFSDSVRLDGKAYNERFKQGRGGTLEAIPPNERDIMSRGGKYATGKSQKGQTGGIQYANDN